MGGDGIERGGKVFVIVFIDPVLEIAGQHSG